MRQHVAALHHRDTGKVPELSLQKRQRRDGVVARRDGHHVSPRAVPQIALARQQHGSVGVEVRPHARLEHERVLAQVVRSEAAAAAHRARRHAIGAAGGFRAYLHEELFDGRLHRYSSSSS